MTNSAKASTVQRLRALEEAQGLSPTRYLPYERSEITRVAAVLPYVDVSVTELRQVSYFSKQVEPVDGGYYPRVRTTDLLDISTWFHSAASGGGKYTVELIDPDNPHAGVIRGFTVRIEGPSRKAPQIEKQETMHKADMNLKTNQLAQTLIASGVDPATAYETARKATQENPVLSYMAAGNAPQKEEDEMEKLLRFTMMRDLMAKPKPNGETSQEVLALREQMKAMENQLAEERRRADEARHQSELRELKGQMETLLRSVQERPKEESKTDWVALAASLTSAFGGMFSSMNSQQQSQATSQVAMLEKVLTSQSSGRSDMVNAVMTNMMNMMQLQVQQQQARMAEPMQQMQVMGEMAKMTGGLLQAMVEMQRQLSGDDPAWLKVALDMMGELPEIIKNVAQPIRVREIERVPQSQPVPLDETALREETLKLRALEAQADKALQEAVTPPSEELPSPTSEEEKPPTEITKSEALEIAKRVVNSLAIELFVPLLEKDHWVEFFFNLSRPEIESKELGYRFVEAVISSQETDGENKDLEALVFFMKPLETALERNLDWSRGSVREFVAGMEDFKKERNVRKSA